MWMLTVRGPDADLQHERPGNNPTKRYTAFDNFLPLFLSRSICPLGAGPSGCFVCVGFTVRSKHHRAQPGRLIGKRFARYEARGERFHHLGVERVTKSQREARRWSRCTHVRVLRGGTLHMYVRTQTLTARFQGRKIKGNFLARGPRCWVTRARKWER